MSPKIFYIFSLLVPITWTKSPHSTMFHLLLFEFIDILHELYTYVHGFKNRTKPANSTSLTVGQSQIRSGLAIWLGEPWNRRRIARTAIEPMKRMTQLVSGELNNYSPSSNATSACLSAIAVLKPSFFSAPCNAPTQIFSPFWCQNPSFFLVLSHPDFFLFRFRCPATLHFSQPQHPHLGFFHFQVPPKTLPSTSPLPTHLSTSPFPTQIFSLSFLVLAPRFLTFFNASKPFLFGHPKFWHFLFSFLTFSYLFGCPFQISILFYFLLHQHYYLFYFIFIIFLLHDF